jgi:hypothetical protein
MARLTYLPQKEGDKTRYVRKEDPKPQQAEQKPLDLGPNPSAGGEAGRQSSEPEKQEPERVEVPEQAKPKRRKAEREPKGFLARILLG